MLSSATERQFGKSQIQEQDHPKKKKNQLKRLGNKTNKFEVMEK